jgi:hypothetical protein
MAFEDLDVNNEAGGEPEGPPEESSNRMFLIAAGVLGVIAILVVICIAVYVLTIYPRTQSANATQKAMVDSQNTQVARIIASTSTAAAIAAIEAAYTPTPTATELVLPSPTPSQTLVVAMPSAEASETIAPEMATATALNATLTANAVLFAATLTAKAGQPTAIPTTGFADEVGLPAMLGLAVLLIAVIFLARRLRTA